ncbi:signal recognition particle protein [Helicobacter monodelphidis]|uniref:signal recognition particle protein n=1 Tax=Helicobacter sp. 15-1451 TaxID=2004995 RepID=UPI000DCE9517|nr:signal recognition particle protein [Helicobacter sp. 15-1451]RAX58444.1 signal recognition particle protein [Helicobacter sp. 15-1451]
MFDTLSESFKGAINKIRFSDDEKSLKRALDDLKKALLKADVHFKVVKELLRHVESQTKQKGIGRENFLEAIKSGLNAVLDRGGHQGFVFFHTPPTIVLMVGLQGSGKTTTTAKLAHFLKGKGKKILLAACDLQRLAAVEQLRQLSTQVEVDFFALDNESNPVEVAKQALKQAESGLYDVLLLDTAGRLAIDEELMAELKAIKNAINPFETFYVADSLSGQDGIRAAKTFHQEIGISGVILSKFDGDSKGGIALSVAYELELPLRFIGNGEKIADIEPFIPERVVGRLMGAGDIATLAERSVSVISPKEAKEVAKKIKKGSFTFNDFLAQLENVKKLGSMQSIISMIPGMGNMASALKDVDLENSVEIKHIRAIVNSMTPKEREDPSLLNGSRRKRIANGAGLSVADVNRLIKQFDNAAKIAKKFSNKKGGMADMMNLMQQAKMGQLGRK